MHEPIDRTYYYTDESDDDIPMSELVVPNNDFKDDEEYGLYMLYAKYVYDLLCANINTCGMGS
jgi:hypothetical protein